MIKLGMRTEWFSGKSNNRTLPNFINLDNCITVTFQVAQGTLYNLDRKRTKSCGLCFENPFPDWNKDINVPYKYLISTINNGEFAVKTLRESILNT